MKTNFTRLNENWNADPNGPMPEVEVVGTSLKLTFYLNYFIYDQFEEEQKGTIDFTNVTRYRLGSTNDEGWYRGQCRFSGIAPNWGEFYLIEGNSRMNESPDDWIEIKKTDSKTDHYLFYFRDETFECKATSWTFKPQIAEQVGGHNSGGCAPSA